MLRTKERLENERHTLRKEETSGRRSIEAAYSASLSLYKNASALFVQRNTEETELRSVKDAILTKEIKEIEEELRQIQEDDAAAGYHRSLHAV